MKVSELSDKSHSTEVSSSLLHAFSFISSGKEENSVPITRFPHKLISQCQTAQNEEARPGLTVSPLHSETARKMAMQLEKQLKVHCVEIKTCTMLTKKPHTNQKSLKDLDSTMYPTEYKEKVRTLENSSTLPKIFYIWHT